MILTMRFTFTRPLTLADLIQNLRATWPGIQSDTLLDGISVEVRR